MTDTSLSIAVLIASPRVGVCEGLAHEVTESIEAMDARADVVRLRDYHFEGCCGCGTCDEGVQCPLTRAEHKVDAAHGFASLYERIDACSGLVVISPIYFAGPPSQLKAFYDRLQFMWAPQYSPSGSGPVPFEMRKPAALVAVGEGGDPFGYTPLVTCTHAALRMMGFELDGVAEYVGASAQSEHACAIAQHVVASARSREHASW